MKKLLCILICLALFAACNPDSGSDTEEPTVVFGVMSDTHIGAIPLASQTPEARLQKAYETFTRLKPGLDAIVTVGDFTDHGTSEEYNTYKRIMDEYSTAKVNLLSMGNHDNMNIDGQSASDRFLQVFHFDAVKDTVINGYHFITVSTRDSAYNTGSYQTHREWLEERLAAANAQDPHKPVFVFIHHTMKDTKLIGHMQAEASSEGDLYDVFSQYPQVVAFSGHSHVSVADPRNIWQGDYTALNCGSVLYTALDFTHHLTAGKTDNALDAQEAQVPHNRGESSTALIVEVRDTEVTVRRIDLYWDEEITTKFVFDTSAQKADFPYLEAKRIAASVAPAFASGAAISIDKTMDNGIEYSFPHAMTNNSSSPDDGAFAYTVSIKEAATGNEVDTARLQAEYFMLPRPATLSHATRNLEPDTSYEMSITPIGYFGKEGAALTKTFKTAEEGAGEKRDVYPIPISVLTQGAPLPPGMTMDAFIGNLTGGYNLMMVNMMFGEAIFFKDQDLEEAFTGADTIDSTTIIYSIVSLEELMTYL